MTYYSNRETKDFRYYVYNRFRIHWFMENDFNMADLLNAVDLACGQLQLGAVEDIDADERLGALEECGMFCLEGDIWPLFEDFMRDEYHDRALIERILPLDEFLFSYLRDIDNIESMMD